MKKLLFPVLGLMILFAACCKEDTIGNNEAKPLGSERFYGVKTLEETRGLAQRKKLWYPGTEIDVNFLNGSVEFQQKVKQYAAQWEQHANITFNFIDSGDADVRIAFDSNDSRYVTWSTIGTDCKMITNQAEPTMNFVMWDYITEQERKGDVLRAFGQVLGLELEHRHLDFTPVWLNNIQTYWEGDIEDIPWDELRKYVFDPLESSKVLQSDEYDENSIMIWPFPRKYAGNTARDYNYELSETDIEFIGTVYPKEETPLPTIQEAWVNPGYLSWLDDTKTSLRLTELGKQQEYLPDVSDGEQLTSADRMFMFSSLKKAPKFNTSNITNFYGMFYQSFSLVSIPEYNTSKGTTFRTMFDFCKSLTEVPYLDTSNGTDFAFMFSCCESLRSVPELNTSKSTDSFSGMFQGCKSLKEIPPLDTSNGVYFDFMFAVCESLETIPFIDTSKGYDFTSMFNGCILLKYIPNINTSKGYYFNEMFYGCHSLTIKPELELTNIYQKKDIFKGTPFE